MFPFFVLVVWTAAYTFGGSTPTPEAFSVLPLASSGPQITPYLQYQTQLAWREDEKRMKVWDGIRTEQDLLRVQKEIRQKASDHARRTAHDKDSAKPARHGTLYDG